MSLPSNDFDLVTFSYTNHKGRNADRYVRPIRIWFGSTAWYPTPQWLLEAVDLEKLATRDFAMDKIRDWEKATGRSQLTKLREAIEDLS